MLADVSLSFIYPMSVVLSVVRPMVISQKLSKIEPSVEYYVEVGTSDSVVSCHIEILVFRPS